MPLFEYKCRKCGHVTVFLEKAGRGGRHACEECGSAQMDKVFSTFAARSGAAGSSGQRRCSAGTCPLSDRCPKAACDED